MLHGRIYSYIYISDVVTLQANRIEGEEKLTSIPFNLGHRPCRVQPISKRSRLMDESTSCTTSHFPPVDPQIGSNSWNRDLRFETARDARFTSGTRVRARDFVSFVLSRFVSRKPCCVQEMIDRNRSAVPLRLKYFTWTICLAKWERETYIIYTDENLFIIVVQVM